MKPAVRYVFELHVSGDFDATVTGIQRNIVLAVRVESMRSQGQCDPHGNGEEIIMYETLPGDKEYQVQIVSRPPKE